jgi:hypothetical protein
MLRGDTVKRGCNTLLLGEPMVKTTIDIDDERWKKFSIKVIEDFGGRKKNDVIEALVERFLHDPELTQALEAWLQRERTRSREKL